MKTFEVIATIKQIITSDNKENAIRRANSLIDVNGTVSFNTGKINYQVKNIEGRVNDSTRIIRY